MNNDQKKAFSSDLQKAVAAVMAQHSIPMAHVVAGMDAAGSIVIKITAPKMKAQTGAAEPTPNAIARYKKLGGKLGLPSMGTILTIAGKEYALVGLSSDGSRVKARLMGGAAITDLPLADVQAAIASAGAKKVAAMDAAEQVQADVVDPDVAAFLAAIGQKAAIKPAEGQQ